MNFCERNAFVGTDGLKRTFCAACVQRRDGRAAPLQADAVLHLRKPPVWYFAPAQPSSFPKGALSSSSLRPHSDYLAQGFLSAAPTPLDRVHKSSIRLAISSQSRLLSPSQPMEQSMPAGASNEASCRQTSKCSPSCWTLPMSCQDIDAGSMALNIKSSCINAKKSQIAGPDSFLFSDLPRGLQGRGSPLPPQ